MVARARTILIVDDNEATRNLLVDLLSDEGYVVECASHGRAAIARIGAGGVDLVLLDWRLPDLSGGAVLEELSARQTAVPVVILSAGPPAPADAPPGAVATVSKPFEIDELLAVLSRFCPLPPS